MYWDGLEFDFDSQPGLWNKVASDHPLGGWLGFSATTREDKSTSVL
jgi:hypothetical protein